MKPKVCCRPNTTIKEVQFQTYPNLYPLNKNRLPIIAGAVSADMADTAGNFETQGSKFSHETARSAGVLMLLLRKSNSILLVPN